MTKVSALLRVIMMVSAASLLAGGTAAGQEATQDTVTDLTSQIRLDPGAFVQFRFTANHREPPQGKSEWITGFQVTRLRFLFRAEIKDVTRLVIRMGTDAGGLFKVERAFVDVLFGRTTLRLGQFALPGNAELKPTPDHLLTADYSPTAFTFDPGSSQGVMAVFRPGNWRISTALSAGFRAGFSQSGEGGRANVAITAYLEHRFLGEGWSQFATMYSNRDDPTGLKVGLAAHWQTGGHTGDTDSLDLLYASTDIIAEGRGWTALGQFTFTHSKPGEGYGVETGKSFNDMGFVIQGGKLVTRRIELFVRYDQVIPDGKERDPGRLGGTGTDHFRTLTGGISLLALPDKSLGRVTLDFQYAFDAQSTSIVPTALNAGIFESDGPQWTLRLQWVTSL